MVDVIEVIRDPTPVVEVIYPAGPQGPEGPQGPPGADSTVPGPQGPTGPAGPGVATGGTTGQLLTKTSAVDFATAWLNPPPADLSTVPLLAPADDLRNTYSGAAGRLIISSNVPGDSQPRFTVGTRGTHSWGDGANPVDVTLSRRQASQLAIDGALVLGSGASYPGWLQLGNNGYIDARAATNAFSAIIVARNLTGDTQDRFRLTAGGQMTWGDGTLAADTTLNRRGPKELGLSDTSLTIQRTNATDLIARSMLMSGDTQSRMQIDTNGRIYWGPGGSTAVDTYLYRNAASSCAMSGALYLGASTQGVLTMGADGYLNARLGTAAGNAIFVSRLASGDVNDRFRLNTGGSMSWGDGTAAADTTLARTAAARLALTGMLTTTLGVATRTKAGTPADADWTTAPPDGTIVIDTTASRIWARLGGVWKSAALA